MSDDSPIRRRWFQFSLRRLFVVSLLVGLGFAWIGMQLHQKRRHEAAVNEIVKLGGRVGLYHVQEEVPAWKEWLFGSYSVKPVFLILCGTDATDSLLSQNKGMNVITLDLSSTNVTDAGLVHLIGMTRLKTLLLENAQVTDAGLTHLKGLTSLHKLTLDSAQVTDAGLTHLKGLTSLNYLDLRNTQITDAGLTHLKGLTNLDSLILINTHVTQAGVDRLRQAIPRCVIYKP